jgi:hypothetical protein
MGKNIHRQYAMGPDSQNTDNPSSAGRAHAQIAEERFRGGDAKTPHRAVGHGTPENPHETAAIARRSFSHFVYALAFAAAVLCILAAGVRADTRKFLHLVKQWSEWGEYDKVIEAVPEYFDTASAKPDNISKAELHKLLGVAFFATGKVDDARVEFILAYEHNNNIKIDKNYVSEEIYMLFMSTIDSQKRRKSERAARDSLESLKKDSRKKEQKSRHASKRRASVIVAATSAAFACLFAGAAAYEFAITSEEYDHFKRSAESGDLSTYESKKKNVEQGDRLTIGAAAGAGTFAVVSTVFFIRWRQRVRQSRDKDEKRSADRLLESTMVKARAE